MFDKTYKCTPTLLLRIWLFVIFSKIVWKFVCVKVKLAMLNVTFLVDVVERDELIAKEPQCWQLVNRAKNYHLLPQRVMPNSNTGNNSSNNITMATSASSNTGGWQIDLAIFNAYHIKTWSNGQITVVFGSIVWTYFFVKILLLNTILYNFYLIVQYSRDSEGWSDLFLKQTEPIVQLIVVPLLLLSRIRLSRWEFSVWQMH